MNIVFSHSLGTFTYDEQLTLLEHEENNLNQSLRFVKELAEGEEPHPAVKIKKSGARNPTPEEELRIRQSIATPQNLARLREICLRLTKDKLKRPVQEDAMIMSAVGNIEELTSISNTLAKKAREWLSNYLPEASRLIEDNERFVEMAVKPRSEIITELSIKDPLGSEMISEERTALLDFLLSIRILYEEKRKLETYVEEIMQRLCPNLTAVAGAALGAKLIKDAGGLDRLAKTTSTTVQMLGAERALFRHLRNKNIPPPKHGHIINHPLLLKARPENKGKVARALADKITIAVRIDYFHGEYRGDLLRKELDDKFGK
jgi:nucleolar protein 56